MYRVLQVLNNNVAFVKDQQGNPMVVMGLGIAFQKKKGELLSDSGIENVFSMKTTQLQENFLALLKDVPLDFITTTYDVIESVSAKYAYPFQDYLYVTLTDHIYYAYQAVLDKTYQETKLPNVAEDYPYEYAMAQEALALFRSRLLQDLPEVEAGRIALHFINAKAVMPPTPSPQATQTSALLKQIQEELAHHHIRRTTEKANFYDRLMIHLTYFLQYLDRPREENSVLLAMEEQIQTAYPQAYALGSTLYDIIIRETGVEPHRSEKFYIILHLQRLL